MPHARVIAVGLAGQILVFAGIFSFPALAPTFIAEWSLTYAQAGWISGIYFAGYTASVLVLVRMTEHVDARRVYAASAALMGIAWLGFALLAEGFWSALFLRFLGGVGFAGTYMPGLRAMLDRVDPARHRTLVTLYMAGGALGHGTSFLVAGEVGGQLGWRSVFLATGTAALAAVALFLVFLAPVRKPPRQATSALSGLAGVVHNRPALGFVVAYAAHNWEVYTVTAWVVALLAFNLAAGGAADPWLTPTQVGTVIGALAIPAILCGGALSNRFGDGPVVLRIMLVSAALACAVGASAGAHYGLLTALLLVYAFPLYADSPGLTAGAIAAARSGQTADVMAMQTLLGHVAAAVGPPVFGLVLDVTGGGMLARSWGIAFAFLAVMVMIGPLCLRRSSPGPAAHGERGGGAHD